MDFVEQCPVCKGTEFTLLYTCLDTTVSHETFQVNRCTNCNLGITSPRPDSRSLHRYYLSDDYISHSGTAPGFLGQLYRLARNFTIRWKRKIVEHYSKKGTILDFGCGTGEFLSTMQKRNWTIAGVEPSELAKSKAEEKTGHVVHSELGGIKDQKFEAITLWHVLEHVPDLNTILAKLKDYLKADGVLFIAVPNYLSDDATYYKEHWAGYDVPRHLWHFTQKNMNILLKQNGFKLKSIVPMKLDAYYISLLSEKNKQTPILKQMWQAVIRGALSNFKGRKDLNYSSLLYVAHRS